MTELINRNSSAYGNLFSTLAQIAGIFLGLYFTAVSVVASTVYARVQGDVRSLLLRDKVGNHYIGIVAFLAAYTTILLGLMALGYQPSVLSLLLAVAIGVAAIFSFVVLGYRSFHFFDPTNLVGYLMSDLSLWVKNATPAGLHWEDQAFQIHYQKQAAEALSTYRNMVSLANSEEQLQNRSLVELGQRMFWLLRFYTRRKLSIPTESRWFKRTYRHKDWLTTNYSETSIAMNAGTVLSPDEIPDLVWFEDEISKAVTVSLSGLLSRKDLPNAYEFFGAAQNTIAYLSKNYAIDEAMLLFRRLTPLIHQHAHKGAYPDPTDEESRDALKFALALIDLHALSFINILLGFSEKIRTLTADSLGNVIGNLRWQHTDSIYRTGLPRKVVEQLEYLRKGLEFERSVEDHYVSPVWYRQQHVAISFLRFMAEVVSILVPELEKITIVEVRRLTGEDRHLFAAQLIERGLEACNKFSYHYVEIEQCWDRLGDLRRMHDMPWPSIDWKKEHEKVASIREQLVISFSGLLAVLDAKRFEDLPDYFGHAYSVVAEECFAAMANGNDALFQKLFPAFFSASIDAHQHCVAKPISIDPSTQFGYCAQPIIDLFEISGYSILFQELDGKGYWHCAEDVWNRYMNSLTDRKSAVQVLNAFGNYDAPFVIFPRSMLRTSWEQELGRRLRQDGLAMNEFDEPFSGYDQETITHPSPIIRVLANSVILLDEARRFFTVVYFENAIQSGELELSTQMRELHESLIRERLRMNGAGQQ